MSGQLPQAFLDFIDHFATPRNDKAIAAIQNAAGTPYGDLCKAYMLQATDLIACRDELLRLAGLPAPFEAWRYQWLGTTYTMLGQLPEAEACFAAAIENNPDDRLKFQVYVNWGGGVTSSNGHNDKDIARRAIAILETGLRLDPPQGVKIRLQANLAINYKLLGRYDEAIQIFQGVREYSLMTGDPLFIAMATSDLADLYRISGQSDKAKEYALMAWETAKDVETVINDKLGILRILIRVLREAGHFASSLYYTSIAIDLAEGARAQAVTEQDRISWFMILRGCYDDAILCYLALGDPASAFGMTERARARTFADLSGAMPVTSAEVDLPATTAIISYYELQGTLWAFVLSGGAVYARELGRMAAVTQSFDATGYPRNLLPGAGGKLRKAFVLDRVAEQIARPLDDLVRDCDRLCVIPFGPLHHVPFSALFNDRPVFTAPSVTVLIRHSQADRAGVSDIAFGYNGRTLSHAEAEAQAIGEIAYVGPGATRTALYDQAPRAKRLHFSTHGYFDPDDPARSYVELADGPLYASEIASGLQLHADLVVLSACDSGRNRVLGGDEPLGLIRSFITAGAASVLVTLWPVDEVATRLLMEDFYTNLRAGNEATKALHMAQRRLRTMNRSELPTALARPGLPKSATQEIAAVTDNNTYPFSHPYWWAGFTLVGERLAG